MTLALSYDRTFVPPAPVVPVGIAPPAGGDAFMLRMLIDTGADGSLIPIALARRLGLPRVDDVGVSGIGGAPTRASVYAARVSIGSTRHVVRLVAFADEAILGRDVLRALVLELDGQTEQLSIRAARAPRRRPRAPKR